MTSPWPAHDRPFSSRHIGPDSVDRQAMLQTLGLSSLDELADRIVPADIRIAPEAASHAASVSEGVPPVGLSEQEVLARLQAMAADNKVMRSMIGLGYHDTFMPPVIGRNVLENPAWYTAYTPYQPEISQGRLEALLNFQTLVSELTGLEVANASLLDEATACAEAMAMARRVSKAKGEVFFVDEDIHPQVLSVLQTRAQPQGWRIVTGVPERDLPAHGVFGALLAYPGSSGAVRDLRSVIEKLHAANAIAAVTSDPLALVMLQSPGGMGADIVVGSMQRFGLPMGNGGPHAGFMATREAFKRHMPGRIVGVSRDTAGRPALRLALQTREQHIRREKATSNICTAQALPAMLAAFYAMYHGPEGLRRLAGRVHAYARLLREGLNRLAAQTGSGIRCPEESFFDTLTVEAGTQGPGILQRARQAGINLRDAGAGRIGISCDEATTPEVIRTLWRCFGASEEQVAEIEQALAAEGASASGASDAQGNRAGLPRDLLRPEDESVPAHPVFSAYQSETEMLRYLRRLADRDLALDRTMIPLGSCTMKLNPSAAMQPITWEGWARIHPYAPEQQKQGYRALYAWLEKALCQLSGYDAVSLQPNSGAQGEFAGLMAIRAWQQARGEGQRDVCLIPASAHGTNPASAQLAGLKVAVIACDAEGNVDVGDLKAKLARHAGQVAAIMVTYPSTHGVFEARIREICDLVHEAGGQVYLDGANLNAQVGLARSGHYGADVSHFNLHKTFCIPHGGGGPGMGPIGVKAHLAPYLPQSDAEAILGGGKAPGGHADPAGTGGLVSGAPYGSASLLPISAAYMMMMGIEGLKQASEVAMLNANYIAGRLQEAYPVLFRGADGFTAHECILDLRPFKESAGVTVDDIAKRLVDYGFHAPTVSFPVPGTLMVEPTESESKAELDRFCDAMLAIRAEIAAVERGTCPVTESPLRHAPHTALDMAGAWAHPYSRLEAGWPFRKQGRRGRAGETQEKYWPPVGRVDNAWGDRNLVCACPDISAYVAVDEETGT
ncbi:aminomethyl-transferring glycine dehydrogenase [Oecophyllibacter saccharovorans]|uniref:aminomethyl-transferring glycine dehydrogenase n=1 Tax=Oecophyllibacter saccharovorans TaxID=2558360 RepID=UPI0011440741|nr:aminomethyl-transferring glycine dehydrogenase [Oecophyllibacter saccharovorans]QDH15178.1 aminomethyl-transferring glycine dehydrogenase [Oecophyllibacter saccharovorans]